MHYEPLMIIHIYTVFRKSLAISLVGQWLRLCASSSGGSGSIPGWKTKILHATQPKVGKKKKKKRKILKQKGKQAQNRSFSLKNWPFNKKLPVSHARAQCCPLSTRQIPVNSYKNPTSLARHTLEIHLGLPAAHSAAKPRLRHAAKASWLKRPGFNATAMKSILLC